VVIHEFPDHESVEHWVEEIRARRDELHTLGELSVVKRARDLRQTGAGATAEKIGQHLRPYSFDGEVPHQDQTTRQLTRFFLYSFLDRSFVRGRITFTPEDMGAVRACLEGIDRKVPVTVEPAAAKLLMPNTVSPSRTLALVLWPAEQLRLVLERWQLAAEVRIERIR
jgi:hypothetical protein